MKHPNDPFRGLRTPAPPADLESKVLETAGRLLTAPPRVSVWDRLWTSMPLRLAWTLVTAGLLVAHVALSLPSQQPQPSGPVAEAADELRDEDLKEVFDLPHLAISPRAAQMCLGPVSQPVEAEQTEDAS